MGQKKLLRVMVVNREFTKEELHVVDFFHNCKELGYDMVIFPFKEDKRRTEVIYFDYMLTDDFFLLFQARIETDGPGFFDFDLEEITEETFYDILDQQFTVMPFNLTDGLIDVHNVQNEKD
jgi:hypothetical protein